jgi:hypothetical protein
MKLWLARRPGASRGGVEEFTGESSVTAIDMSNTDIDRKP